MFAGTDGAVEAHGVAEVRSFQWRGEQQFVPGVDRKCFVDDGGDDIDMQRGFSGGCR